jgi:chromosome partitioning protein
MRKLLVFSPKGGVGKSSLARNMAVSAKLAGMNVATLDTDPQGTLTRWWNRRPEILPPIDHYQEPLGTLKNVPITIEGIDLLVIDTPTSVEAHVNQMSLLLTVADYILIPTGITLEDLESTIVAAQMVSARRKRFAFLINRVKPRVREIVDARRKLSETGEVVPVDIPDLAEIYRTDALGLSVQEVVGAKSAPDFAALWSFLVRKLEFPT